MLVLEVLTAVMVCQIWVGLGYAPPNLGYAPSDHSVTDILYRLVQSGAYQWHIQHGSWYKTEKQL